MIAFIAGVKPEAMETEMPKLLDLVQGFDGLVEIRRNDDHPNLLMLCFETKEQATTAQWLLDLNGGKS